MNNTLGCADGTTCEADDNDPVNGGWDCCKERGGRIMCPFNYPYMCAKENACAQETDYCCEDADCGYLGGERECPGKICSVFTLKGIINYLK